MRAEARQLKQDARRLEGFLRTSFHVLLAFHGNDQVPRIIDQGLNDSVRANPKRIFEAHAHPTIRIVQSGLKRKNGSRRQNIALLRGNP